MFSIVRSGGEFMLLACVGTCCCGVLRVGLVFFSVFCALFDVFTGGWITLALVLYSVITPPDGNPQGIKD